MIQLLINGTDYTSCIDQVVDVAESPRYVSGPNAGTAMNGDTIPDLVAIKWDCTFKVRPLSRDKMAAFTAACSSWPVEVKYTTHHSAGLRTIKALPAVPTITYCCDYGGGRIYQGGTVTFSEV